MNGSADQSADLVDSVDLCGAFCVWLTMDAKKKTWLNGRFLEAKWDVDELSERKGEIVEKDLLRAKMAS